jgi:hypothetical protein
MDQFRFRIFKPMPIVCAVVLSVMVTSANAGERLPDGGTATTTGRGPVEAWYEDPTTRYNHGALGDAIEAGSLAAVDDTGQRFTLRLPEHLVYEDITPRLADLDGDGRNEIITIRTDVEAGAAVAVYGIVNSILVEVAATPPIGRKNRWLSIAAIGKFLGTHGREIAIVKTPHIGGQLELLVFAEGMLKPKYPTISGVTTHVIGSRHLTLAIAHDLDGEGTDELVIPSQSRTSIYVLNLKSGADQISEHTLPSPIERPITIELITPP